MFLKSFFPTPPIFPVFLELLYFAPLRNINVQIKKDTLKCRTTERRKLMIFQWLKLFEKIKRVQKKKINRDIWYFKGEKEWP